MGVGPTVVATYNIHRAIGRDGAFDPARVAEVLAEIDPHVVALQEVQSGSAGRDLIRLFRDRLGAEAVSGVTMLRQDAEYGNALLTRHPVLSVARLDLSVPPHEPRGALDVRLDCGGWRLRVVATHLGLWPYERRRQVRQLLAALADGDDLPTVLLGDLNEWWLWGRPVRWLHAQFRRTPAPPTFPSKLPVFALDRLWVRPRNLLRRLAVHASPLARIASDHLPLVATLAGDAPGHVGGSGDEQHQRAGRKARGKTAERGTCEHGREICDDLQDRDRLAITGHARAARLRSR